MTVLGTLLRVLGLVAVVCVAAGAEVPIPPMPTEWVTDTANFLSPQTIAAQNARLKAYEKQSGHQVLVYIAPTTAEKPVEDWTVRAFGAWKVGRKGLDDGTVLFIFPRDRTARIEVGYGLESVLPDVTSSRIIRDTIVPEIRAGRPDGAVVAGVDRMLAAIGAKAGPKQDQSGDAQIQNGDASAGDAPTPLSPLTLILIGFVVLAFIVVAIKSPSTALFLLFTVMGRGGGGSMGGGGGFSGGGGRSGGGGASGRW